MRRVVLSVTRHHWVSRRLKSEVPSDVFLQLQRKSAARHGVARQLQPLSSPAVPPTVSSSSTHTSPVLSTHPLSFPTSSSSPTSQAHSSPTPSHPPTHAQERKQEHELRRPGVGSTSDTKFDANVNRSLFNDAEQILAREVAAEDSLPSMPSWYTPGTVAPTSRTDSGEHSDLLSANDSSSSSSGTDAIPSDFLALRRLTMNSAGAVQVQPGNDPMNTLKEIFSEYSDSPLGSGTVPDPSTYTDADWLSPLTTLAAKTLDADAVRLAESAAAPANGAAVEQYERLKNASPTELSEHRIQERVDEALKNFSPTTLPMPVTASMTNALAQKSTLGALAASPDTAIASFAEAKVRGYHDVKEREDIILHKMHKNNRCVGLMLKAGLVWEEQEDPLKPLSFEATAGGGAEIHPIFKYNRKMRRQLDELKHCWANNLFPEHLTVDQIDEDLAPASCYEWKKTNPWGDQDLCALPRDQITPEMIQKIRDQVREGRVKLERAAAEKQILSNHEAYKKRLKYDGELSPLQIRDDEISWLQERDTYDPEAPERRYATDFVSANQANATKMTGMQASEDFEDNTARLAKLNTKAHNLQFTSMRERMERKAEHSAELQSIAQQKERRRDQARALSPSAPGYKSAADLRTESYVSDLARSTQHYSSKWSEIAAQIEAKAATGAAKSKQQAANTLQFASASLKTDTNTAPWIGPMNMTPPSSLLPEENYASTRVVGTLATSANEEAFDLIRSVLKEGSVADNRPKTTANLLVSRAGGTPHLAAAQKSQEEDIALAELRAVLDPDDYNPKELRVRAVLLSDVVFFTC